MHLDIEKDQSGRTQLSLHGRLTFDVANDFRLKLQEVLSTNPTEIVVDLSDLEYIDTSGLGVFVAVSQQCRQSNTLFRLVRPREKVMKIFRMTKLNLLLDISE